MPDDVAAMRWQPTLVTPGCPRPPDAAPESDAPQAAPHDAALHDAALQSVERLSAGQRSQVLDLVRIATHDDLVAPLSEQVLLAVGEDGSGPTAVATTSSHLLAYDGTHLSGYAHLEWNEDGEATAEIVVDPRYRRQGIGTALIRGLEDAVTPEAETIQIWSHGDFESARALAARAGFSAVRELWQMRRPLGPEAPPLPSVSLPDGFRSRHFVVGRDEEAWLAVNARAFVNHPEQGRITRRDLDRRVAEPWFDAEGFILVEDLRGGEPVLAASHWTKVVPVDGLDGPDGDGSTEPVSHPTQGEVYVVGVDPQYQGLGLGRAVTLLGLTHLSEQGLSEAMLYVDGDNAAAVATYSRLGFTRTAVDIMYSRIVHLPV